MRAISDTIGRLAALRSRTTQHAANSGKLERLEDFGSNPGALDAWFYMPEVISEPLALVVVLHGCTQNASGYDRGAGWSQLADERGFAVLLPEQRRANNMNLCFNWYEPANSVRGAGEPLSIVLMIQTMIERHGIDPDRVFVTGLSAGGAMTSVMLATYPEVFAGGAIIAGLAYGTAANIPEAFDRMRGHGSPGASALAASVRAASPHRGPWPSVSVWHGSADHTVDATNGDRIIEQWLGVHAIASGPSNDRIDGYPHRVWRDANGKATVEEYRVTGMGHGTPLAATGADACGASGPYMLEVAISSTRRIAHFWGLTSDVRRTIDAIASTRDLPPAAEIPATVGVGKVIEDALRAAGLMR